MDYTCDKCGKPAPFHLTDIRDGKKTERHLCKECAAAEGLKISSADAASMETMTKLLEEFVLQAVGKHGDVVCCQVCGMSFDEYRKQELLGCPNDYDAFGEELGHLVERVQDHATQHVGKVPLRASQTQKRLTALLRLRTELRGAVQDEDYERAARLRDQIRELEN